MTPRRSCCACDQVNFAAGYGWSSPGAVTAEPYGDSALESMDLSATPAQRQISHDSKGFNAMIYVGWLWKEILMVEASGRPTTAFDVTLSSPQTASSVQILVISRSKSSRALSARSL